MMCDRYWREGILLVERGLPDPHREGCADCQRAHASREELIDALPLIGEGYTGDPRWQSNVWERIEGKPARPLRWLWPVSGAFAVACILLLLLSVGGVGLGVRPDRSQDVIAQNDEPNAVEVVPQPETMRATGAHVDDVLRIQLRPAAEAWVYRDGHLVLHCAPRGTAFACTPAADATIKPAANGTRIEMKLSILGQYQVLTVDTPPAPPRGDLDEDLAALQRAGRKDRPIRISVH